MTLKNLNWAKQVLKDVDVLDWKLWISHNATGLHSVTFSFQPDMLDIVKSARGENWKKKKKGKKAEPSPSSTLTSRGSCDPSTLTGGLAPCPFSFSSSFYSSSSSDGDEASLVAADWVRHHAAAPPPGHTSLPVEFGVTPQPWGRPETQPVVAVQFVLQVKQTAGLLGVRDFTQIRSDVWKRKTSVKCCLQSITLGLEIQLFVFHSLHQKGASTIGKSLKTTKTIY